ncbi:CU044_2847 family protein [Herpetosiphon giganteus]|uniref:CU044_2847 family protein n=1 Tax=Herpetosiphon giganteus TaxID=2029754 RepID=UPI00195B7721|nr:CU044_2847 family protein [Herpetosiphon giganteus]MBM7845929.1 hypothetical protein [Herpetosiphon giganteus]
MTIIETTEYVDGEPITFLIETSDVTADGSGVHDDFSDQHFRSPQKVIRSTADLMGEGFTLVRNCAKAAITHIKAFDQSIRPNEFEIQLAIKLSTETGAILAKVGAEAQLQVKLLWKHQ